MCSDVLGPLSLRTSDYVSSGTSAFSLRLMPSRLAAGAILTHSGSSAAPPPPPTPSHGPISFTYPIHLGVHSLMTSTKSKQNLGTTPSSPVYLVITIWSSSSGPRALFASSSRIHVPLDMFQTLTMKALSPPDFAPNPSVRNRIAAPCPVPQVGVSLVSYEQGPTGAPGLPMPSYSC